MNEKDFFEKMSQDGKGFHFSSGGAGRVYTYDGKVFTKGTEILVGDKLPLKEGKINESITPKESPYCYAQR